MVIIYYLLCFILGIVFNQWIYVLLDALIKFIHTWFEAKTSKYAIIISENNDTIQNKKNKSQVSAIGFSLPEYEEEEEDDDYE